MEFIERVSCTFDNDQLADFLDLNIDSLLNRLDGVKEVIIATNPNLDGETTALFIAKLLENKNIKITRLAYGLPMGGNLEYSDDVTIMKSFENRKSF